MATVRDILAHKESQAVTTVGLDTTVFDAAQVMDQHRIGCLVVVEGSSIRGVFSERDVLRRVVVQRRDPITTPVRDVMTTEVMCCHLHTSMEEVRVVMKDRRIRHIPVVNEHEQLCGIISIGDINAHDAHSKEMTIHQLHEYIYGPGAVPT